MIEFPFERRQSQRFGTILKPIIPVRISGPARSINIFMLLDSGADLSILPYSVGETLGLQLDNCKQASLGSYKSWFWSVLK